MCLDSYFDNLFHTSIRSGSQEGLLKHNYIYTILSLFSASITVPTTLRTTITIPPQSQRFDGCKYYQVLSDQSRSVAYHDWSSFRCDKELFGWYRFMGQAGNRMLTFCPAGQQSHYKCGSFYQGWLQGSHPGQNDGTVMKTVCFSPHSSCHCSYSKKIYVRNCGEFYVYWLDATPACNVRYCGAKGQYNLA